MYMEVSAAAPVATQCVSAERKRLVADATLITLSVGCTTTGIVLSVAHDALAGTGFLLAGFSTGFLTYTVKALRLSASLATSAQVLRAENDELSATNEALRSSVDAGRAQIEAFTAQNGELSALSDELSDDVAMLRSAIGAVGATGDDILNRLRHLWKSYRRENDRHSTLVRAQTRLQLVQIMQHYDTDTDAALDEQELAAAMAYLHATFPHANIDSLVARAREVNVTIEDMLDVLDPSEHT